MGQHARPSVLPAAFAFAFYIDFISLQEDLPRSLMPHHAGYCPTLMADSCLRGPPGRNRNNQMLLAWRLLGGYLTGVRPKFQK